MNPPATFFGFFMAAVLNLPDRPLGHKLVMILVFLALVLIEKTIDRQREPLGSLFPALKGAVCFLAFAALSLMFLGDPAARPLRALATAVGGAILGMTVYMPLKFQGDKEKAGSLDPLSRKIND